MKPVCESLTWDDIKWNLTPLMYVFVEPRTTSSASSRFRDEIESCLANYLGGKEYLARWVYSPYYHPISRCSFFFFCGRYENLYVYSDSGCTIGSFLHVSHSHGKAWKKSCNGKIIENGQKKYSHGNWKHSEKVMTFFYCLSRITHVKIPIISYL